MEHRSLSFSKGLAAACALAASTLLLPPAVAAQEAPPESRPGLAKAFFDDAAMNRGRSVDVDQQIDMDTGATIRDFSTVWLGSIAAPVDGEVTFIAEADNGLRLWIGDESVIDGWSEDGEREGTFHFSAPAGRRPFRLEYFQNGGTAHMRLYWRWEGQSRELIPAAAFSHTAADENRAQRMVETHMSAEETPVTRANARLYTPGFRPEADGPMLLRVGPHLFIDDLLIESCENVRRVVNVPTRDAAIPNPVVTGREDGCFQPYMTVLRDPDTGLFRIWYGHHTEDLNAGRSHIGYLESEDGIHWQRPARVLEDPDPIQFGISVIDDGVRFPDPALRYKFGWYMDVGLKLAVSPDGLSWTPLRSGVVLTHNHDINSICYDPLRSRYLATLSVYRPGDTWTGNRRITMQSHSMDLLEWARPHYVLLPDPEVDAGETQFYAMEGYLIRGDLMIGMVKVLRDDLKADDPPDPPEAYGVGYTTLAWTRDGETWTRDPAHFFDPDPEKGAWDHAHAWIDEQVPVGDKVYLYYGGYARGHKVNRFEERQIGLVTIKWDRYVARAAGPEPGVMRTPPVILSGGAMTLNVDADGGTARVRVVGENGQPLPGFGFEECEPIHEDALAAPVTWERPLRDLAGKTVQLEFMLENARLFGIGIE